MKSVIIEGANAVTGAMGLTKNPAKPIGMVIDLGPMHPNTVRVVFINDSDATAALGTSGDGWKVRNEEILTFGFDGRVIYMHPDVTKP
jgi:hypothetical protein